MGGVLVPFEPCSSNRAGKNGLAERDATQRCGIKTTERVKRIAFDRRAFDRFVQERKVESGVVADKYGALTTILTYSRTHSTENALQCVALVDCGAQRMIRIDAVYRKRRRFHICTFEWLDVITNGLATRQDSAIAEIHENGGDFQQRIRLAVESAGFHIDDDGQKTAKAAGH
jgi:hypothetical protein